MSSLDDVIARLADASDRTAGSSSDREAWWRASVQHELAAADGDLARVAALAEHYDQLLSLAPQAVPTAPVVWQPVARHARRRLGSFATPPHLAEALVDRALLGSEPLTTAPAVVDPACGAGALLVAALRRLVGRGVPAGEAVTRLHGVDVDPTAVAVAHARLVAEAVALGASSDVAPRLAVGDALVDDASFTWRAAFPEVLAGEGEPDAVTGWSGGFDVVLANPPWERLKVAAHEHDGDDLATARDAVRDRVTAVREGGRHPLTGTGDLNAHLPFLETCWRLLAPGGRAAVLAPLGALTDRQAGPLLLALLDAGDLEQVHGLADGPWFDAVTSSVRVGLVTLRRNASGGPGGALVMTSLTDPRRPDDATHRTWTLDADLVRTVNPSSGTAVLLDTPRDVELVRRAHERHGVLLRRDPVSGDVVDDPWTFRARTPVHLSREARHVSAVPGEGLEELGEAKFCGLLDPRAATWDDGARPSRDDERADPRWLPRTRWWVPSSLVRERYGDLLDRGWLAGYRVVSTPRTARTLLPVALPPGAYANSLALLDATQLPLLVAALSSLPLDYVARAKAGGNNLSLFKVEQLPVPRPAAYDAVWDGTGGEPLREWVLRRLAAAVAWCEGLASLAAELGLPATPDPDDAPPARVARAEALADLDAVHAHLLGWTTSDLEHVLGTFTALRARDEREHGSFVTRERVLRAFERVTPRG
ncbi:hypothetical protein GCM10027446_24650 [Angustibacter peucedani]